MIVFKSSAYLDILEVDVRILVEIDEGAEEVEEALTALEALEQLDEALCGELLVVPNGDLDHDLQVLSDVSSKHRLQTLKGVLNGQGAKIVDQPFRVEQVGVYDSTLKRSREHSKPNQ